MALGVGNSGTSPVATPVQQPLAGEDIFAYLNRRQGKFDLAMYCRILGAANEYKEGDEIIGVSAANDASRQHARRMLSQTRVGDIDKHPPFRDELLDFINADLEPVTTSPVATQTLGELKAFLLESTESDIKSIMPWLSSDVIGCVVKLFSNAELIALGAKVFNPLPGSQIGAKGYLGARVQPNSPTDHPDDIRWQVFDAFSFAVGDVLLGTNPVSSEPESVLMIEQTLQEIMSVFDIGQHMPHCVLSHIDVQAEAERRTPGSTELWFQSIAGTVGANGTFDVTIEKMKRYAAERSGPFALYFETGQGADFTNGHGNGFDMVLHESRKYGFARALKSIVAETNSVPAWVHLNDVAGFIGPEVFRTREQLVRCCLEDIVMGKLHGLCIGLDVCSTLHMDVSLDDLDWCLEQIAPANPAYLMALPTKINPMLGYLTTGYHDHVRLREKFGMKVNDAMWTFYQQLGVIDERGQPTEHFGDPNWVYLQYCRRKGDTRDEREIISEGTQKIGEVRDRGLFVAEGHGQQIYQMATELEEQVTSIYEDGKDSIWAELTPEFVASVPNRVDVATQSMDRTDYILHPDSGERLSRESVASLQKLADSRPQADVQIVISDGLNAHSIMDEGHLKPFLGELRARLEGDNHHVATENILIQSGRVRTGYRIGETIFGNSDGNRTILHIIGERPGTGHHTFSVYITMAPGKVWAEPDKVDHNITKVVSGIATTALPPAEGAAQTARLLRNLQ